MQPKFKLRKRHDTPLTLLDRLVFAMISSAFGAVLGFIGSVFVAFVVQIAPPLLAATLLSAGYFFCVGALRGAEAGDHVGDAITAVAALGAVQTDAVIEAPETPRRSPWASIWVLAPWAMGMIALFVML